MPATLSQIRAWSTEHLIDTASYWTATADRWEDVFLTMRNESHAIAWQGAGGDALRQRTSADLPIVSGKADQLRQAAGIARNGAGDISAAQRRVLYAVEDAQNAGFNVGEDLSVTDTRTSSNVAEQAARQAQAQAFAGDIRLRAEQLEEADLKVAGQLTATTADLGTVGFASDKSGVQLVDFTQHSTSAAPPNLPQPIKDFINYQLQGKPLPPMTGPPITEIENRIKVIQQAQEWQQWLAAHPDQHTCGTGDIMKALGAMAGGDLSLLAGAAAAPETFTASFWVGLMGWAAGQATAIGGIAQCAS
ncbi:hypothetical protein [Mycobacterium lacus]|uniref:Uncharacterized protein n=1 Tax=Mycobacterium lacus TaxID=169765 RepID=A0A7I7NE32_9MYCO|nr:hypothetical protein [Mycobacterium lacus]BBX94936.1 hypothetical protein MLAC_02300 [Mycobacterium lacus]